MRATEESSSSVAAMTPRHLTAPNNAHLPWAPHWAEYALLWRFPVSAVIERIGRADRDEALKRKIQLLRGEG